MYDQVSLDTLLAVELYAVDHDDAETARHFELAPDTISRYRRELKRRGYDFGKLKTAREAVKMFGPELATLVKSGGRRPVDECITVDFSGEVLRFGAGGDTHFGSKYTPEEWWRACCDELAAFDAEFFLHVGDLSEGMSNRAGHVYELSHIGYDAQKAYCTEMVDLCPVPIYLIDGNHDRWFRKSAGAVIVKDVCDACDNATFLGHDTATIHVGGIEIMLWHGEDGASYAHSYRPQKVIEAIPVDDLPAVAFMGHTHKRGWFESRGVEVFQTGSIQMQTPWMKSTRKAAQTGFWLIELTIGDGQINSTTSTWRKLRA